MGAMRPSGPKPARFDRVMSHSTRAEPALARLPEVDPAIAALALWCTYRDGDGPTTTSGDTIYVGPEFPLLAISEQTGLIAHHVLHVVLRHSARRSAAQIRYGNEFRAKTYDLACDAIVNEALLRGGHALPRPAVRAADIVALLPAQKRPADVLADWDSDTLYAAMATSETKPADGTVENDTIKNYAATQEFEPDLQDSDPDKADAEIWAGRVEQAMTAGQRAGAGIGAILTRFGELPKAIVPWEIKLRRILNKALSQNPRQTYRRPARSWLARDALARQSHSAQPVFEPGFERDERRPRIVIGLDTSSSILEVTLNLFAAEAISIIRRTGAEAHLLGFDIEVHMRGRFERPEAIAALTMRRGGGTRFDEVLSEAKALDPSLVVVLTDLGAPVGPDPIVPVLWAVPEHPAAKPDFGEVFVLSDKV